MDLIGTINEDDEIDYNDESEEINESEENNKKIKKNKKNKKKKKNKGKEKQEDEEENNEKEDNEEEDSQSKFFFEDGLDDDTNQRTKLSDTIKQQMKNNERRNINFQTSVDQKVERINRQKKMQGIQTIVESESEESEEKIESSEDEKIDNENSVKKDTGEKKKYFESILKNKKEMNRKWEELNLSKPLLKSIEELGWKTPTPIQSITIPRAMNGKDICASAVTGSGKTGAFLLPVLERLLFRNEGVSSTRVLILEPTRELAIQGFEVLETLTAHTNITCSIIVGGLSEKLQRASISKRPDIILATPGRLIDHLMNAKSFDIDHLEILILDEADRLLELGFEDQIYQILKYCPVERQTMLFSATMSSKVDKLIKLSLKRPLRISADPVLGVSKKLVQEFVRVKGKYEKNKEGMLLAMCTKSFKSSVIIFFHTKKQTHRMKIIFSIFGLKASEMHGNLTQNQRLEALQQFKERKVDFMLTTNLAARGIDITGIETVINYNMPSSLKKYIHRVGRTARAGAAGRSVSFVTNEEKNVLKKIIANNHEGIENKLKQREIPTLRFKKWSKRIESIEKDIDNVYNQEKHEKQVRIAQMELNKAHNLIEHHDEISSRPRKEWFQSSSDKKDLKEEQLESYLKSENPQKERNWKKRKTVEDENPDYDQIDLKKMKLDELMGKKITPESGMSRKKRRSVKFNEEDEEEEEKTKKLVDKSIREAKKNKNNLSNEMTKKKRAEIKKKFANRDQYLEKTYFPENSRHDPIQSVKSIFNSEMARASLKVQKAQDSSLFAKKAAKQLLLEDEVEKKKLQEFDPNRFRKRRSKKKGVKKFKSLSKYNRKK